MEFSVMYLVPESSMTPDELNAWDKVESPDGVWLFAGLFRCNDPEAVARQCGMIPARATDVRVC